MSLIEVKAPQKDYALVPTHSALQMLKMLSA